LSLFSATFGNCFRLDPERKHGHLPEKAKSPAKRHPSISQGSSLTAGLKHRAVSKSCEVSSAAHLWMEDPSSVCLPPPKYRVEVFLV